MWGTLPTVVCCKAVLRGPSQVPWSRTSHCGSCRVNIPFLTFGDIHSQLFLLWAFLSDIVNRNPARAEEKNNRQKDGSRYNLHDFLGWRVWTWESDIGGWVQFQDRSRYPCVWILSLPFISWVWPSTSDLTSQGLSISYRNKMNDQCLPNS